MSLLSDVDHPPLRPSVPPPPVEPAGPEAVEPVAEPTVSPGPRPPAARSRPRRRPWRPTAAVTGVVAANLLAVGAGPATLRAVIILPVAVVVPGALVLRLLGGRPRRGWNWLLHAVALSVAVLTAVAVAVAELPGGLTHVGSCLVGFDLAVTALAVVGFALDRTVRRPADRDAGAVADPGDDAEQPDAGDPAGAPAADRDGRWWWRRPGHWAAGSGLLAGAAAVGLAAAGAHRLNAGGGPALTAAAFACVVVALAAAMLTAVAGRTGPAATIVYLLSLAVLLATSLRGTGVTGHDIKIEYRVLLDTVDSGAWHPGGPYVGYRSCLSLTVLPAFLARLLGIAPLDVFRICFQVVVAVVPVGVLLIARRMLAPPYAVAAAGLFVAFPTFVNDLPMLNRQEIALLFFTVLILALIEVRRRQRALVLIAAAGLTVSHYSSTGVAAAVLLGAWGLGLLLPRLVPALRRPEPYRRPASLGFAAAATLVMAVGWATATGSADTFATDLYATGKAVVAQARVLSDSTRYSPVTRAAAVDDPAALRDYLDGFLPVRAREGAPAAAPGCAVTLLPEDTLPPTALGVAMAAAGVPPGPANTLLRHGAVLLYEGGAVLGCLLLWWLARRRGRVVWPAAAILAELGTASLALLASTVLAPQLTDSYGLLRLYQQLLPVLGVALVVAMVVTLHAVLRGVRAGALIGPVVATVVAVCLLTTGGLLPRLTGGYPPQLNLANAGSYYRAYLTGPSDLAVARWLGTQLPAGTWIVADSRDTGNLRALTHLNVDEGVAPGAVPADAYLVVDTLDRSTGVATAVVGDRAIRYTFPLACVAAGRPTRYAAAGHVVYAPLRRKP